jgi:hypothetical protein
MDELASHEGWIMADDCGLCTLCHQVVEAVKASGTAGAMSEKQLKQTIIPFAKVKADEAERGGAQVRSPFRSHFTALRDVWLALCLTAGM